MPQNPHIEVMPTSGGSVQAGLERWEQAHRFIHARILQYIDRLAPVSPGRLAPALRALRCFRLHTAYLLQLYTLEMDQWMLATCLSHMAVLADRDALYQCLRTHRGCTAAISGNEGITTPAAGTVDKPNNQ